MLHVCLINERMHYLRHCLSHHKLDIPRAANFLTAQSRLGGPSRRSREKSRAISPIKFQARSIYLIIEIIIRYVCRCFIHVLLTLATLLPRISNIDQRDFAPEKYVERPIPLRFHTRVRVNLREYSYVAFSNFTMM